MRVAMLLLFVLVPTVLCAQWRRVGTVMQLDLLPTSATHLEPQRLDPEFLEFVAELPQLRALRFPADSDLPEASLKVLAKSPGLEYLDLSGVYMAEEIWPKIPELLAPCKTLKRLRIDLVQELTFWCGNDGLTDEDRYAAYKQVVLDLLARYKDFRAKGGTLEIGWADLTLAGYDALREALPDLTSIKVMSGDDTIARQLPGFTKLREVTISDGKLTEVGFAYIARCPALEALTIEYMPLSNEVLHHLAKCQNLRRLTLTHTDPDTVRGLGVALAKLRKLTHLTLDSTTRYRLIEEFLYESVFELPLLECLHISDEAESEYGAGFGFVIATKRLEIRSYALDDVYLPEVENPSERAGRLRELSIDLSNERNEDVEERIQQLAERLKGYPGLKQLRLTNTYTEEPWDLPTVKALVEKAFPGVTVEVANAD